MPFYDGPNKRIILNQPTGGVLNVNVQDDLYETGKRFVQGRVFFDTELNVSATQIDLLDYSLHTGQRVIYLKDGGTEAIGLTDGAEYFVRYIDRETFELYDTKANAEAGPATTGRQALTASGGGSGETHQFFADNSKWFVPWRTTGGDPLTPGVEAGAYFFIQNQLGSDWRIIAFDDDHTINYAGNLVAENSLLSLIVPTPGRTVLHLGLQPVTQRVDEILTQTQEAAYNGVVSIDVLSANSGTAFPVGTRSKPVNNLADAATIAATIGTSIYEFRGALTLDRVFDGNTFIGITSEKNDVLNFGGFNVDRSIFRGCGLTGSYTGSIEAIECDLQILSGVDGVFRRCGISDNMTLAAGAIPIFANCFSEVPGTSSPIMDCNGASGLNLRNYSGGIQLRNVQAGFTGSIDLDPGTITMLDGQGNTGGTVQIAGTLWNAISETIMAGGAGVTAIVDKAFDAKETQIALASLVGNADVSLDNQTITILNKNLATLRELSLTINQKTRRIV